MKNPNDLIAQLVAALKKAAYVKDEDGTDYCAGCRSRKKRKPPHLPDCCVGPALAAYDEYAKRIKETEDAVMRNGEYGTDGLAHVSVEAQRDWLLARYNESRTTEYAKADAERRTYWTHSSSYDCDEIVVYADPARCAYDCPDDEHVVRVDEVRTVVRPAVLADKEPSK